MNREERKIYSLVAARIDKLELDRNIRVRFDTLKLCGVHGGRWWSQLPVLSATMKEVAPGRLPRKKRVCAELIIGLVARSIVHGTVFLLVPNQCHRQEDSSIQPPIGKQPHGCPCRSQRANMLDETQKNGRRNVRGTNRQPCQPLLRHTRGLLALNHGPV